MHHAIIHRRAKIAGDSAILRAIARSDGSPTVSECPTCNAPLQNQAIGGDACLLVGAGQFIEKENAGLVFTRQKVWKVKSRLFVLMVERRQSANVRSGLL
jgi:hypothetical protein